MDKMMKDYAGYMFDSLVFRFKEYQYKAFESDVWMAKAKGKSDIEAHRVVQERHNRDLMRFIQILDEAIGEHS